MKKFLSVLAVLGVMTAGIQTASAFTWSNLNPFNWGRCNKCEKKIEKCPCSTGYAAPCNPCEQKVKPCDPCNKQVVKPAPCDPCDRIQQEMAK